MCADPFLFLVSLFVTDYREYAFLPGPLVGFHPPVVVPTRQRSVLGLTGFLQFFKFVLDPEPTPPFFELHPLTAFPGQHGFLPRSRALLAFIAACECHETGLPEWGLGTVHASLYQFKLMGQFVPWWLTWENISTSTGTKKELA